MEFEDSSAVWNKRKLEEPLHETGDAMPSQRMLKPLLEAAIIYESHKTSPPIHWVPQELLTLIFIYCIPEDYRFISTAAPFLLCEVCHSWRNIVISTPSFWNRLAFWSHPLSLPHYRYNRRELPASCYPVDLANKWLERSGGQSLELFFERFMAFEHLKLFMPILLLQRHRCQHLELNAENYNASALVDLVSLPAGSLVQLESLVLEGLNEADFGTAITVFQASPRLQRVTTDDLNFATTIFDGDNSPRFNPSTIPWTQLTYLVLTNFIKVKLFTIMLSECSKLEFLRASLDGADTTHNITRTTTLSALKEVYFSIQNVTSIPLALNHFKFPALQIFHFRRRCLKHHPSKEFSWHRSKHFRTQLSKLCQLSLVGEIGSIDEVLNLLHSVSSLTKLLLDIEINYEELLPRLFPMSTSILSPITSLHYLELHLYGKQLRFSNPKQLSQPCLFHMCPMLESTSIRSLHAVYHRGDPRKRASGELKQQFSSSRIHLSTNVIDLASMTWTRQQEDSRMMNDGYHIKDDGSRCGMMRDGHTMKEGRARLCFTHTCISPRLS